MFWLIKCDFFRLFHTERSWHAYWFSVVIVPGNIVDFWNSDFLKKNSDFLKKSQFDLPSAWISFLYLLLCLNFFSWHFPLHEFFFCFFPTPHITFLMVRPLNTSAAHWDKNRCLCEFVPKKMYHSLLSLKMISFILFPQASQPSMNLNISELVYYET